MKILILSHDFPSPWVGSSLRLFHLLKFLSKKYEHNITLVSLKEKTKESRYYDLKDYCNLIEMIEIPESVVSFKTVIYVIKNMLSPRNIFSKNHSFLSFYYSPKLQKKVKEILKKERFNLILAADLAMAFYVLDINIPKIIDAKDAVVETARQTYMHENKRFKKMYRLLRYYKTKRYERIVYKKKFDAWIVVSPHDKDLLKSYMPDLNISVIPNGVDIDFFKPFGTEQDFPSLIFVGDMSSSQNTTAVIFFYNEIYPLIKKEVPDVKLYLVGRNPSTEISKLSRDESVVVTGYVEDVRPYLAKASVMINPMVLGMGIKNKVLEAMAMEKPVVSTSLGARGIDISPEENIIIADDPKEFAKRVVEVLGDEQLRERLTESGKRLVETNYSWEKMADMLNELFKEVMKKNANK